MYEVADSQCIINTTLGSDNFCFLLFFPDIRCSHFGQYRPDTDPEYLIDSFLIKSKLLHMLPHCAAHTKQQEPEWKQAKPLLISNKPVKHFLFTHTVA